MATPGVGFFVDSITIEATCSDVQCQVPDDCPAAPACEQRTCTAGQCGTTPIEGCCTQDGDCENGDPCTTGTCSDANTCLQVPIQGCCTDAADCNDDDVCTTDVCTDANQCQNVADPDCCEAGTHFSESFGQNLDTFTVIGDGSDVGWQTDNNRAVSGAFSLYYGNPDRVNFDTGARTFGSATSESISIPAAAQETRLKFEVWVDVGFFNDLVTARVAFDGQVVIVWDRDDLPFGGDEQWVPVDIALPAGVAGEDVQIIFDFDSVTAAGNGGEGVYIDDVEVFSVCEP